MDPILLGVGALTKLQEDHRTRGTRSDDIKEQEMIEELELEQELEVLLMKVKNFQKQGKNPLGSLIST